VAWDVEKISLIKYMKKGFTITAEVYKGHKQKLENCHTAKKAPQL
jgi:hypothetical protein